MAELTTTDLALIRDEIGTSTPPTDDELRAAHAEAGHWIPVAIRILKRRRAAAVGSGVSAVNLSGLLSVTLSKSDLGALDSQISRLEARWASEQSGGEASTSWSRLTRTVPR